MVASILKMFSRRPFIIIAALVPIVFLAIMLILKSVNVPNWDEWEMVPIFMRIHAGHLFLMDFWRQHNEHRIIIPNIILVTTAYFTRWNLITENFLNLGVAIASFLIILKVLKTTGVEFKQKSSCLLIFLVSLIWFSLVQSDNWLWGWEIEWFLNVLGVSIVAYCLSRIKSQRQSFSVRQLGLLLLGGVIAQYSLGNGTLVWPIVVLILLYMKVPLKQIAAVIITGAITTFFYYYHYTNTDSGFLKLVSHQSTVFARYFFIYLGRPLNFEHNITPILGLVIFTVFIGLSASLLIRRSDIFKKLIPWVYLGTYAIGSAFITGLARISFGTTEAYVSRYTTISSLLLVSVVVMLYFSRDVIKTLAKSAYSMLAMASVACVFFLVLGNYYWGFHSFDSHSQTLKAEQQCTHMLNPSTACLLTAYPNASVVSDRLDYLKQIHWGGY